jgi:CRISPR-associated protein Csb2
VSKLHIAVRFLSRRYHGEEWPPAPARLLQALISGGRVGANGRSWTSQEAEALQWLEGLEPPEIRTTSAKKGARYSLFVPDNESDVAAKQAIEGGRFDLSKFRTRKPVSPRVAIGPETEPDVLYSWGSADGEDLKRHAPVIGNLARKLYSLGWGIDMAFSEAQVSGQPPYELQHVFIPASRNEGTALRVPVPGFSADVLRGWDSFRERVTEHGVNPYTKVDSYAVQHYRKTTELPQRAYARFRLETLEGEGFSWPWIEAPVVAAWLRHAAAAALCEEGIDEATIGSQALGHGEGGNGDARVSYVPVPTIGQPFQDGAVRRVLLVESFGMDGELVRLLQLKMGSRVLTEAGTGRPRARLGELPMTDGVFARYRGESEVWSTVTPVVLHGYNTFHRRLSQSKTERLLVQAFQNSGYPESLIREMAFRPACSWQGPGAATAIRVPRHLSRWPRYHVWVRFADLVRGPVLAGIGRHYGLGLFAHDYGQSPHK